MKAITTEKEKGPVRLSDGPYCGHATTCWAGCKAIVFPDGSYRKVVYRRTEHRTDAGEVVFAWDPSGKL